MTVKKVGKRFLLSGFCTVLGSGAVFAADIKANIQMSGDVMRVEKTKSTGDKEWSWLSNEPRDQKDDDGLIIEVDNGNAGAHIALWYRTAANNGADANESDDWQAYFRRTYVWFRPVDMLKVQGGYVGCDEHFKEQIDEWKVGSPFSLHERDWYIHPGYIGNNDVEGWGFGAELRPIEQLVLNAGITPGAKGGYKNETGTTSASKEETSAIYNDESEHWSRSKVAPWGAGARYFLGEHFEFQASFRDGGQYGELGGNKGTGDKRYGTWRVVRFGAGYKDENVFAFIQPILGFDYDAAKEKWKMNGYCFDLYGDYSISGFKFYLHAPVTIRRTDEVTTSSGTFKDFNYMELNFKAEYNTGSHGNLDDVKPYVQLGSNSNDIKYGAWILDKDYFKNSLNLTYKVGVNCMISGAEIDLGVQYEERSKYARAAQDFAYGISIPFSVKFEDF